MRRYIVLSDDPSKHGWSRVPDGAPFIQHASLDAPLKNADGNEFTRYIFLADEHDFNSDAEIESAAFHDWVATNLDEREQRIIEARHLHPIDEKPVTRDDLSRQFGISGEWVRQLEINALHKLSGCKRNVAVQSGAFLWPTSPRWNSLSVRLATWKGEPLKRWSIPNEILKLAEEEKGPRKPDWVTYKQPYRGLCPTNMLFQQGVPRLTKLPTRSFSSNERAALAAHKAILATHLEIAQLGMEGWRTKHDGGYSESDGRPNWNPQRVAKLKLDNPNEKRQRRDSGAPCDEPGWTKLGESCVRRHPISIPRKQPRKKSGWKREGDLIHLRRKKSPHGGLVIFKADAFEYWHWPPGQPVESSAGRPQKAWGSWRRRTPAKVIPFARKKVDSFSIVQIGRAA